MKKKMAKLNFSKMIWPALSILPFVLGLLYVKLFGVNVVFWDEWAMVPLFAKLHAGTLTLTDLYVQLNEHRIFIPNVIILFTGVLTHFNTVFLMYLVVLFMACIAWIFFRAFQQQTKASVKLLPWFAPIAFMVFNFNQYFNYLMGFQISFLLMPLAALFAFYSMAQITPKSKIGHNIRWLSLAILGATVATFTHAGLFVWPVLCLQLLLLGFKIKDLWKYYVPVLPLAALQWYLYIFVKAKSGWYPSVSFILEHFKEFAVFFFANAGISLSTVLPLAFTFGLILSITFLLIIIMLFKQDKLAENSFSIATAIFSYLLLLSIAGGRFEDGIHIALSSKYCTFAIILLIAIYLMVLGIANNKPNNSWQKISLYIFTSIMVISMLFSYPQGFLKGIAEKRSRAQMANTLLNYRTLSDTALKTLFYDPELVREQAYVLEKLNYSVFNKKGNK